MSEVNFTDAPGGSPREVTAQQEETAKLDAARAELVDEATGANELILGKYETTDDLAAAYQNLQREYTALKNGAADQVSAEPANTSEPATSEAEPVADQRGLDPTAVAAIQQSIYDQAG
jgi:hypothetical protein